jgi:phenylpropionate dioxygenase-like ring-hydroxylating dioxygenase large terminal subunit
MNVETTIRANDWDRRGLPAWTYHSQAMLELEKSALFHTHWQIAGHVSDIPNVGDYFTFDVCGERAVIIRSDDGQVRAFHNLCRHRGSRVVGDKRGQCKNALVCPFHGWVYNLDGSLRGAARPKSYADLDKSKFGLRDVEAEVWMGFIFVRFKAGPQGKVAEVMAPLAERMAVYKTDALVPAGAFSEMVSPVNWKSVRDVDNEGYHVAMAHPALQDLYGSTYFDMPFEDGVSYSAGTYNPHAGRRWSVRNYVKIAPEQNWLPPEMRKLWGYHGLFPNNVIITTPETVQFYQEFPLTLDTSLLRGGIYRRPVESRAERLARYLTLRIDRETSAEDVQLSVWSNESMKSSAFEGFYLSDLERGVRSHHDHLRHVLPVMTLEQAPAAANLGPLNDAMLAGHQRGPG